MRYAAGKELKQIPTSLAMCAIAYVTNRWVPEEGITKENYFLRFCLFQRMKELLITTDVDAIKKKSQ